MAAAVSGRGLDTSSHGSLRAGQLLYESLLTELLDVCSVDDPVEKQCSGHGTCKITEDEKKEPYCVCDSVSGYNGKSCSNNFFKEMEFTVDCTDMSSTYYSHCMAVTASDGACSPYKLAWRSLCYDTCISMYGSSCLHEERAKVCPFHPKCPSLCSLFYSTFCIDPLAAPVATPAANVKV